MSTGPAPPPEQMSGVGLLAQGLVDAAAAAVVNARVSSVQLGQQDVQLGFFTGLQEELARLRQVTDQQAATIAALQAELAQARSGLPVAELARSVAAAVTDAADRLDGWTVARAQLEVRTVLDLRSGVPRLVSDPSGLVDPQRLSTLTVSLDALPPGPGQPARPAVLADVRARVLGLQLVVVDAELQPQESGPVLAGLAGLAEAPAGPAAWALVADGLDGWAGRVLDAGAATGPRDDLRRLARLAAATPDTAALAAAAAAIAALAAALRGG